jgi:hypothetical protein
MSVIQYAAQYVSFLQIFSFVKIIYYKKNVKNVNISTKMQRMLQNYYKMTINAK